MPDTICVKLIHIHFELLDNEVMAFKNADVPSHDEIETLGPHKVTGATKLFGCHHFVNDKGELQAFEYQPSEGLDMSTHHEFVREFCKTILDKGLQRTFGLSLRPDEQEQGGWTVLEYPQKRMTFNVPTDVELLDVKWLYVITKIGVVLSTYRQILATIPITLTGLFERKMCCDRRKHPTNSIVPHTYQKLSRFHRDLL
jgi:hypothetical protein